MIRNQWYVVLDSTQVAHKPIGVLRLNEKLVFWRDMSGKVVCLVDQCSHRGASLCMGQLKDNHIQCPFHGLEFDSSGRCCLIPANGRQQPVEERFAVTSYPTHEAHGFIWIWWGKQPPTTLPRFFTNINKSFSYSRLCDPWNTHYSRAIENQLDVVHLPFVHYNTIGRGNRTLIDGPGLEIVDEDMFRVYVYNRVDDGTLPRKPSAVPVPDTVKPFKLEFIFPNLWQNFIAEPVRIVVAFVPVDNEHSLLYLRFYQNFMRVPGVRWFVNQLAMPMNRVVLHQDRRVVEQELPKISALKSSENLLQGDHPIIHYRRRRQELQDKAAQL